MKYNRCKHENRSAWVPPYDPIWASVLRTKGYEICNDCGGIFDVCPHTNLLIEEPYYTDGGSNLTSTGYMSVKSVTCLDCKADCPSIIEEIEPCEHKNKRLKETVVYGWGDSKTVEWCDDCECIIYYNPDVENWTP